MHNLRTGFRSSRPGFTLIEMLVVITILTILITITATSMSWSANKDRIPNAANEVSSFIMGGRDRAIYRRSPTGVRLILDQNGPTNSAGNPVTVTSMMYIGSPPPFTGRISIEFDPDAPTSPQWHLRRLRFFTSGDNAPGIANTDDPGDLTPDMPPPPAPGRIDDTGEFADTVGGDMFLTNEFNDFTRYFNLGLLDTGNQISLSQGPATLSLNFTLVRQPHVGPGTPGPGGFDWFLSADYPAANVGSCMDRYFSIDLRPAILPNQEPRELPKGVVIDLEPSRRQGRLPGSWYDSTTGQYSNYMDIIYSPRGTGTGEWSGFGLLNLLIAEAADVERSTYVDPGPEQAFYRINLQTLAPPEPEERPNAGQERVVSVNPQTGRAGVSALLLDDLSDGAGGPPDNIPDDPFQYAERGKTAK